MYTGNTVHVRGMHLPNCPSFDGNMSAQEWFQKFNVIHEMHGYGDQHKLKTVQLYFTSQPLQWYNNLSESDKSSWDNFTQAFRSRYLDCNRFNIFSKIGSTKQLPNECVMDFVSKLQTLARPLNFSEDQLLPSLIDNVLPHLKPEILRSKPNSLKEFIEAAKLAENIHQVTNNPSAEYTAQIHHLNTRLTDLQSALSSQMQELSLKHTESVNALNIQANMLQNTNQGHQQSNHNNFKNTSNKQNPNRNQKQHYQPPQQFNPRPMLNNNQYYNQQPYQSQFNYTPQFTYQQPQQPPHQPQQTLHQPPHQQSQQQQHHPQQQQRQQWVNNDQCQKCGGHGHDRSVCNTGHIQCQYCGKYGHHIVVCRKQRKDYVRQQQSQQSQTFVQQQPHLSQYQQ